MRKYLIALTQGEARVMGEFVDLVRRIVLFIETDKNMPDIDRSLKLARSTLQLLVENNRKELTYLDDNDLEKPLFKLTLEELKQLNKELDIFRSEATEQRAQVILDLAKTLETQEKQEAEWVKEKAA